MSYNRLQAYHAFSLSHACIGSLKDPRRLRSTYFGPPSGLEKAHPLALSAARSAEGPGAGARPTPRLESLTFPHDRLHRGLSRGLRDIPKPHIYSEFRH